ncbi:hypothetical protein D3C83_106090 [compost metagenome]
MKLVDAGSAGVDLSSGARVAWPAGTFIAERATGRAETNVFFETTVTACGTAWFA